MHHSTHHTVARIATEQAPQRHRQFDQFSDDTRRNRLVRAALQHSDIHRMRLLSDDATEEGRRRTDDSRQSKLHAFAGFNARLIPALRTNAARMRHSRLGCAECCSTTSVGAGHRHRRWLFQRAIPVRSDDIHLHAECQLSDTAVVSATVRIMAWLCGFSSDSRGFETSLHTHCSSNSTECAFQSPVFPLRSQLFGHS